MGVGFRLRRGPIRLKPLLGATDNIGLAAGNAQSLLINVLRHLGLAFACFKARRLRVLVFLRNHRRGNASFVP